MNTRNGHQRNLSENSEADDLFNFDIKKDKTPKRVNTNSGQRPTFGDLKFFNITPNNSANMDNEELLLAPALLTKTPLTEVPKSETLKTPTNKSGRRTPTLRKRKASEDAETPAKLAKVDTDDAFVTPKATPAARSSVKRKLLKIDEEMPVLQAEEQLSDSVTAVNDQENVSQSGGRPRRSAAVKAAAAITLAATPSTSSITTPKTKSRPKSKKEDTKVVEEESSSRGTSELDEANREGDIAYDKIFNELQFILTSAARNSSSSTFVKKEVRKQIESRGGNVVETFESMNPDLTTKL
uniref:BRCT domain-containing protein n=1 Tax=Panagrolaimus superbus TaxID=310955 RepID=A0A914YC15_9BILA